MYRYLNVKVLIMLGTTGRKLGIGVAAIGLIGDLVAGCKGTLTRMQSCFWCPSCLKELSEAIAMRM